MNDTNKIRLHYLLGDVHWGGHDVHRVAEFLIGLLDQTGVFDITCVCDEPRLSDITFDDYFASGKISEADVFVFNCGNYRFNIKEEQVLLEEAVARGAGFVFLHGDHPCYWAEVGMKPWAEVEKMAGLMWREPTRHGDYADAKVRIDDSDHPVTCGLCDFVTRDEVFCTCSNVHGVPLRVLASAYSDPDVISRHGLHGTGAWEPMVAIGQYGQGKTLNLLLGHVWPFYTGHGIGEDTMLSWKPKQVRQVFVRACEWAATGDTALTESFIF